MTLEINSIKIYSCHVMLTSLEISDTSTHWCAVFLPSYISGFLYKAQITWEKSVIPMFYFDIFMIDTASKGVQ